MDRMDFFIFTLFAVVICTANASIALYYNNQNWEKSYLHYSVDGKKWNSIPGDLMSKTSNPSYPGWKYIVIDADEMVFVTTDGQGHWDNNYGQNYHISSPGNWVLSSSNLHSVSMTPSCQHGTLQDHVCVCQSGYFGYDCSETCSCAHGKCLSATDCQCESGWSTCSSDQSTMCNVSVSSDPFNCGKCGNICQADPSKHEKSAVCSQSKCTKTCAYGYRSCPDGSCVDSSKKCTFSLPGCQTYKVGSCSGQQTTVPPKFSNYTFQTPAASEPGYKPFMEGRSEVVGYPRVIYNSAHTSATVSVITFKKNPRNVLIYCFDGNCQKSPSKKYDASYKKDVVITVKSLHPHVQITLDEVSFIWNVPPVAERSGDYRNGRKGAIIELFGWPFKDIAKECEFIGKAGYLGIKIQAQEHLMDMNQPFNNDMNPWYFNYQPTSFAFQSRGGSRDDLKAVIKECHSHGVRVYNDAIVNHNPGSGNDRNHHRNDNHGHCDTWEAKGSAGDFYGNKGATWYTNGFNYETTKTGFSQVNENPSVPYLPEHYHCTYTGGISWNDPHILNVMSLDGLVDVNTEHPYVQQRIGDYFNSMLSIGFSGFRMDGAKHMNPQDIAKFFKELKQSMGGNIPSYLVTYLEVLTGGERDMLFSNPSSSYSYTYGFKKALQQNNIDPDNELPIWLWDCSYPIQPIAADMGDWAKHAVIQNDDNDQGNSGSSSRDLQDKGDVLIHSHDPNRHRSYEVKLFQNPYGVSSDHNNDWYPIRLILSSFYWNGGSRGVPDSYSDCAKTCKRNCSGCQNTPYTPAYDPNSCGYDSTAYTRVHRDSQIINAMRQWMHLGAMDQESNCS
eukprot:TRINITY_DN68497_c0_g1_i1.p1 TRINITY_DN68497_c0_g1~~TRINITY_DN68497_c0_g1_i1.p1  ORF type:complete len:838 (+),score=159.11 TRINITY_DN68497_c0_g1_i1:103-2616(+)